MRDGQTSDPHGGWGSFFTCTAQRDNPLSEAREGRLDQPTVHWETTMKLSDKLAGWRGALVMWSPGVTLFVLALGLEVGFLGAAVMGAGGFVLGLLAYVLVFGGLNRLLGPADFDDLGAKAMNAALRPVGAAGLVVAALVWGWWHFDMRETERFVVSCVEDYAGQVGPRNAFRYEFEASVEDIVRGCFEQQSEPLNDW